MEGPWVVLTVIRIEEVRGREKIVVPRGQSLDDMVILGIGMFKPETINDLRNY
jgi:hypothetical protein